MTAGELAGLGEFLRREAPRPPTTLLLQHHSGTSNAAAPDAPLLPFPTPPAGGCVCPAAVQPGAGDGGTHAMPAAQAPEVSSDLESSLAALPVSGHMACEPGALDAALGDPAQGVCIRDALGDLTFRISPSAFFQVPRPVRCISLLCLAAPDVLGACCGVCCHTHPTRQWSGCLTPLLWRSKQI